ncbi:MAG: porin, partial [Boseongicola sp.]
MKKVLLATTALVASSGFAMAQGIELSGSAEIGLLDDGMNDAQFFSSVDVRISLSGETDNGLTFGASVDLNDVADQAVRTYSNSDNVNNQAADYTVFVSGSFGTLTIGDTDGA